MKEILVDKSFRKWAPHNQKRVAFILEKDHKFLFLSNKWLSKVNERALKIPTGGISSLGPDETARKELKEEFALDTPLGFVKKININVYYSDGENSIFEIYLYSAFVPADIMMQDKKEFVKKICFLNKSEILDLVSVFEKLPKVRVPQRFFPGGGIYWDDYGKYWSVLIKEIYEAI
jgi:hypothetical protein